MIELSLLPYFLDDQEETPQREVWHRMEDARGNESRYVL